MKKAALAMVLIAFATSGCGDDKKDGNDTASKEGKDAASASGKDAKDDAPKKSGLDGKEVVALAEGYADDVCACKKATCINEAGDKYQKDTDALYADKKMRTPTPEQKKKMDAAQARVKECTDKLLNK